MSPTQDKTALEIAKRGGPFLGLKSEAVHTGLHLEVHAGTVRLLADGPASAKGVRPMVEIG